MTTTTRTFAGWISVAGVIVCSAIVLIGSVSQAGACTLKVNQAGGSTPTIEGPYKPLPADRIGNSV